MGGSTPYKEPMGETTEVGSGVKAGFLEKIGPQRMLRGEQLFRRHQVVEKNEKQFNPSEGSYTLEAKILSQHHASLAPGGAYTTTIDFIPMTAENRELVIESMAELEPKLLRKLANATRQGREPRVDEEFKDAATTLMRAARKCGLPGHSAFFPESWAHAAKVSCGCLDYKKDKTEWCKHIAALAFVLLDKCEKDPFLLFEVRGFDVPSLLSNGPRRKRPSNVVIIDGEHFASPIPARRGRGKLGRFPHRTGTPYCAGVGVTFGQRHM